MPEDIVDFSNAKVLKSKEEDAPDFSNAVVLKKKDETGQSQEPSGSDSETPSQKLEQPIEKNGTPDQTGTASIGLTKGGQKSMSDAEVLAKKKADALAKQQGKPTGSLVQDVEIKTPETIAQIAPPKDIKKTEDKSFFNKLSDSAKQTFDVVKNAVQQGSSQGDMENAFENLGKNASEEDLQAFANAAKKAESIQAHPVVKKFEEAKGIGEAWDAFTENPMDVALHLMTKSTTSLLKTGVDEVNKNVVSGTAIGAAGGSVVPGVGTTAGAIAGAGYGLTAGMVEAGFNAEYTSDIIESLKESGIDVTDADQLRDAFNDDKKMAEFKAHALKKAVPIAVFDAFSGGLAGKLFKQPAKTALRRVAQSAAEMGVQAPFDAGGELVSQKVAGDKTNYQAALAEILGGLPQNVTEVASGVVTSPKEPSLIGRTHGGKPVYEQSVPEELQQKLATSEQPTKTIESAVIEIGGQTFEGKNHAEAILKAQQAGKDISQVDRKGQGMFKLSDGSVISRDEAQATFGADKAEVLIPQDENADKANREYEKIKKEQVGRESLEKVETRKADEIVNMPMKDVPDLVETRVKQQENALNTTSNIDSNLADSETGAPREQEQSSSTGVQSVSENVQETGTADAEGVSVGKTSKNTIDARGKLNERAKALGYDGIKQFNTQNVLNENLNEEEKQLLDDYSSHTASVANEKDSSIIESMNDEDFGHWAKSNDVQRGANGTVNNKSDLDLAKKRINILNKRGNKKQADIEQKSLELSKKKDDWTIESWNERFDELLPQEEIDGINKERNDFNKKLNEVLNEPTKEQDIQASVLDQSGTEDSPTKKGAEQVTRKPSQEKIAEKLSKGLSALGKLSEDKKRIKSDGVFVKEKRARNKAIRELDPTNATQAARQYLLERGRLDTKSIQDETGMSLKEMNQLIGIFGTSKSHPNLEKAAENILARHEYLKDKGIEPQDIRNALIDLLSSDRTKWNEDQYNELDPEQLRKKFEASQIPEGFEYETIGIKEPNDEVAQQDFDFQYELSDEQQQKLNNLFYDTETFDAENSSTKGKSGSKRTGTDQGEYVSGDGGNDSRTSAQGKPIQKRYGNNSKSSEEVVSEINSKSLTRIEGLNMGQSQARGTYVSTEAKNRYETADKKAKKAKVKIKTPFTFKSETGIHQFRNDILREQIEQPGSILEEIDFADYRLPDPWDNVTIDDLSDSGIVKLAGLVSDKLIEEGYDSIYWPETKTHEGELVVFDRNNVEIEGDLSPKDKLALGVEALANIYGITKNAKQSDINTKQALNLIAEALYDQLGVTGNALIKAIKDYLKENKIDNLNGEVDKFKTDIINGIEEYKNIVDVQEYIAEIKGKPQVKESKFNKRQRLGIPVNEALQQLADKDKLMYDVKTNKGLLDEANKRIEKDIDEAYEFATQDDPKASELTGMFATAGRLIPILENAIKNADSTDAKAFLAEKLDVLRKAVQKQATIGGQAVQSLVTVGNIMPMRDSVELIAIAQREAFIKKGTKDGKFEESVKSGVKEDAEKVVDNIINNDSKVKELEAKIIELEGKIAGKKKAKREAATNEAIAKIDKLMDGMAFSDATGLVVVIKQGLELIKASIKAKKRIADAIDEAVVYINAKSRGVQWDEAGFRKQVNDSISDIRGTLDEIYDEKQAIIASRKALKSAIREGLITNDFTNLEQILESKKMDADKIKLYIDKLKAKHETEVIQAVSKRIQKNLGLNKPSEKIEPSLARKIASEEKLTPLEIEALFKKKNNLEDITPEQSNKLKELYDEVERVSGDVDLHKEALDKLRHEAQKLVPKTGWAAFMNAYDSIWHYPSILSGHMTQIANYTDALMQSFTPDMISKAGRESFKDQFKGLKSAVNKAKIGLREGFLSEGLLNNGQPDKLNLSRKTAEDFAKEGNKIAKVTKWVGRVMSVPNTFGEAIKFNALSNIIQRDLTAQGFKGRELKDRKNELLFGTAAKMPEYEAMAVEMVYGKEQRDGNDVLKEAKVKRTISNLILEDMQKQMTTIEGQNAIETAERIKDIATYQNDATGLISILPRLVSSLENNKTFGEAIKFINKKALRIDFLNTIANIANSKLNYLPPYGYLRANNISTSRIVKWAWPEWEGMLSHPDFKDPKNFEEKRRILQKANIGTMIVVGASAMAISGAIKDEDDDENKHRFITGDLTPSDIMDMASKHVHKKEAYESVPPNSIKLPVFGWTNYMLTPFAGALAMVGNLSDRMYANKHKELTKESIMADVMWAEARALKSIILDGTPLGSTIESNKPSKMTTTDNALQQVAVWGMTKTADIVGSSIPNLVKSIGKQIDPTLYTPKDLPTIIVKQMGLLNWYSAMGGELKTGYAVDILGNKTGTKSGDRYFNLLLEDHPEDKKIYDLLLASYKEPMNYPALLSSNMAIRVELMNKEEYDKKLGIIKTKFEKGSISQVQMQNQLDALEKVSKKDDDIGNYPLLYSQALEFSGSEFKKMLKENYNDISNTKNSNEKQNKINTLLSVAKDLAKAKYGAPPKRVKNKL